MKRYSLSVIGFLLLGASHVYAEMPYTFSAGTPAKASEVNANFQNLDERVSSLENNGTGSTGTTTDPHEVTYSFVASTPGQEITLGGKTFRIIRIPIKTPDGKKFAITLPAELRDGGDSLAESARYYVYASSAIQVNHRASVIQQNALINGYPARVSVSDYWSFGVGAEYSRIGEDWSDWQYGYWGQKYVASFSAYCSININVNGHGVGISMPAGWWSESQVQQDGIPKTTYDFTDIDLTAVRDNTTLIGYLDKLVDYINIEPLP